MTRLFFFIATGMIPIHTPMRYAVPMLVQGQPDYAGKPECCIKAVQIGCNAMKMNFLLLYAFIRSDGKPSDYPASARAVAKQDSWDAIAKQLEATILR